MNLPIAGATEEQGSTIEEVNRNIVGISDVAEDTATAAKQTADDLAGPATGNTTPGFPVSHRLIWQVFQRCPVFAFA